MARKQSDQAAWTERIQHAFRFYSDSLARDVASRLTKPRIGQTTEDLVEKAAETLTNAIVVDRRLKDLDDGTRSLLIALGLSRQPLWRIADLVTISATRGFVGGIEPILKLLEAGLAYLDIAGEVTPFETFAEGIGKCGGIPAARVFIHPHVATRARGLLVSKPSAKGTTPAAHTHDTDGLDWPLRLALVWQLLRTTSIKLTQSGLLFKRDLTKLQGDEAIVAPLSNLKQGIPDVGVLAFEWAVASGLFQKIEGEFRAIPFVESWSVDANTLQIELFASFFGVERWDPIRGYLTAEDEHRTTATCTLELFCRFAAQPQEWLSTDHLASELWDHHPSFSSAIPREMHKNRGKAWVDALLTMIGVPLKLVEAQRDHEDHYRLTAFGRHLLLGEPAPPPPPVFPQTLMVQPNADVIVYRQGMTPTLIAELSRFAKWKLLGVACVLELNAEETYHGLESGLTLASMLQTLDRHSQRPVPPTISDLLRRWSNKRERITVYSSATLVEFVTPQDLEQALGRGIVTVKITDRIALTANSRDPEFQHLRLIGNRDYDAKQSQCVRVLDDGITLVVDASQSDILLEAEIVHYSESVPTHAGADRRFQITANTIRRAMQMGRTLEEIDRWFTTRTGQPLSPAGRLLLFAPNHQPKHSHQLVVRVPASEIADGLMQWPETAPYIQERLGPTALVILEENLAVLQQVVASIGMSLA